jgi:hypothetical protein
MVALEDKCRSPSGDGVLGAGDEMGREFSIFPKQFSSEMVIVEKLKTIFLVTRKTGCSTMINALHEAYGTDMHAWPASFGELPKTKDGASRMRTQELTDQAKDYYVFAISRDPLTRFYSSVHQVRSAACLRERERRCLLARERRVRKRRRLTACERRERKRRSLLAARERSERERRRLTACERRELKRRSLLAARERSERKRRMLTACERRERKRWSLSARERSERKRRRKRASEESARKRSCWRRLLASLVGVALRRRSSASLVGAPARSFRPLFGVARWRARPLSFGVARWRARPLLPPVLPAQKAGVGRLCAATASSCLRPLPSRAVR